MNEEQTMGKRKEWREDKVMKEKNEYKLNSGTKKRKKKRKRNKREEWIEIEQWDKEKKEEEKRERKEWIEIEQWNEGKIETCEEII